MYGVIFMETLRKNWKKTLAWGIGLGVLGWLTLSVIPDMDALKKYQELLTTVPPALMQAFGIDTSKELTPDAFIGSLIFGRILLFVSVYAVLAGMDISINEEEDGIMDIVMSLPMARWRIIVERFAAFLILTVAIALMMFAGLFIGIQTVTIPFNVSQWFAASLSIVPPIMMMIATTAFLGTVLRRKSAVLGVTAVFILTSYFLDVLGSAVSNNVLSSIRYVSLFTYANLTAVITDGFHWGDMLLLTVTTLILLAGALFFWERRDIGV